MNKIFCSLILVFILGSCLKKKEQLELSFFKHPAREIKPTFQLLPLGSVIPCGWIKKQMDCQIDSGFCMYLDDLTPMIMKDQIFGKQRRSTKRPNEKNLPKLDFDAKDLQWWNGESQGNWFDGFFRTAVLTGNKRALMKTDSIVRYLLSTQDADGYFGVYDSTMRFNNAEGNGELWTQAVALRALLGYYEYTQDGKILNAVKKAVYRTMRDFNENDKNPFQEKCSGGIPHGLMFADVTESLYRYTNDKVFKDYTIWLYKAFSESNPEDNDVNYNLLKDSTKNFIGHSAHTFEHFRVLLYAYYFTGYNELQKVIQNFYFKMNKVILPSGIPFGFENMWGIYANADSTAAEYCDMVEYEISMIRNLQLQANSKLGDNIEKAFFNGMQGARFPNNKAITYDKTDNCYELTTRNPGYNKEKGLGYSQYETRYKYSCTQEDVAVCCVPNACKSYPYYVSSMWMKASDGIAATLYGPCSLNTKINGEKIIIEEKTSYPFSENIDFIIHCKMKNNFKIYLRIPQWAVNSSIDATNAEVKIVNGFYEVSKNWENERSY